MTTNPSAKAAPSTGYIVLPDAPKPEDMNNYLFLHSPGNSHFLALHLGNPDTTLMLGDTYIAREPTSSQLGLFAPDLFIAFNVNPAAAKERNGYVISEQGKPPDFVLEIGSRYTGRRDVTVKREGYAAPGHSGVLAVRRFRRTLPRGSPGRGTGWWTASTNQSPSNSWTPGRIRDTVRRWTCSCGGRTGSWAGTTWRRGGISPGSAMSRNGRMPSERGQKLSAIGQIRPRRGYANSKRNSAAGNNADSFQFPAPPPRSRVDSPVARLLNL